MSSLRPLFVCAVSCAALAPALSAETLAERARAALRRSLAEEGGWTRIHAADALLALGDAGPVRAAFLPAAAGEERLPHRIGLWRVRAGLARTPEERTPWIALIAAAAADPAGPDRLQAVESLAKLGVPPAGAALAAVRAMAEGGDGERGYALWALHFAGEPDVPRRIATLLRSPEPAARIRAAFVLRQLRPADPEIRAELAAAVAAEPAESVAFPYLLGSALLLRADPAQPPGWRTALERIATSGAPGARYEACQTAMRLEPPPEPALFAAGLGRDGDARIGAAWAILFLAARH